MAAEEQKLLPSTAKEVPCSPDRVTFPPFTRLSNMSGGFYVLSDGRCFTDPNFVPRASPMELVPSAP
jgi:hypothetical protein